MSDSSSQTYKELSIPHFKEVFDIVDEVLGGLGIPYYLIGVNAMSLELLKSGIKPPRGTKDIDFAIMISSIDEFENVADRLKGHGFDTVKDSPWRFRRASTDSVIDLLPFGQIEEESTFGFDERYTDLHVTGFKESLEETVGIGIEEQIVNVPPLPAMVVLKLIAWSDRPERRSKDLGDMLYVIEHYHDHNWNEVVEFHFDLLETNDYDKRKIAARVLGREAAVILKRSDELQTRVMSELEPYLGAKEDLPIAEHWARQMDSDIEYARSLLVDFFLGIKDRIDAKRI